MKLVLALFFVLPAAMAHAKGGRISELFQSPKAMVSQVTSHDSYYDWGRGQNGFGYCYEWAYPGAVLNGGQAMPNYLCESVNPSFYTWGRGRNGFGYCYQQTPNGYWMNEGQAQQNYLCEASAPSFFRWARARNGYTYCYQYTANGLVMNNGSPVDNYYCR